MINPAGYRTRQQIGAPRRLRVTVNNDAGTAIDITDRFGFYDANTKIIGVPTFTIGSETGDHKALKTQSITLKLLNDDGWWNGIVSGNIAENVTPTVDSTTGAYAAAFASDGDIVDATGVSHWRSSTSGEHYIGYQLEDEVRLANVRPFKASAFEVWFPTDYNPITPDGELLVKYLATDGSTWTTATVNYTDSTNITQSAGNVFFTTATHIKVVFTEVSTTAIRLYQNSTKGNPNNPNQMAVIEIWPTGTFSTPRVDIASWLNKELVFIDQLSNPDSGFSNPTEKDLGHYVIRDIQRDLTTVTLKLESLDTLLIDADASKVKNGLQWFRGRPVSQLVRHLLAQAFSTSTINGWDANIADDPIAISLADSTDRAASSFGPMGSWKDVSSGDGEVYTFADLDKDYVIEAVYYHDDNGKLYLGLSPQRDTSKNVKIYEFDPSNFSLTDRTGVTYAGYNVWGIWYSDANSKLIAAIGSDAPSDPGRTCTMQILKTSGDAGTNFQDAETVTNAAPCQFCHRNGGTLQYNFSGIYYSIKGVGNNANTHNAYDYFGENIVVPFSQYLRADGGSPPNDLSALTAPGPDITDAQSSVRTGSAFHPYLELASAYRSWCDYNAQGGSYPAYPDDLNVKFTLGQGRCIDFVDDKLIYVHYVAATTTYTVKYYDVSADTQYTIITWSDSTQQPVSIAWDNDASHWYLSWIDWDDSSDTVSNPSVAYLSRYSYGGGGATHQYTFNTGIETYMVPIAMTRRDNTTDAGLVGCVLVRDTDTPDGRVYGNKYETFHIDYQLSTFT